MGRSSPRLNLSKRAGSNGSMITSTVYNKSITVGAASADATAAADGDDDDKGQESVFEDSDEVQTTQAPESPDTTRKRKSLPGKKPRPPAPPPAEVSIRVLVDAVVRDAARAVSLDFIGYNSLLSKERAKDLKIACEVWSMLDEDNSGFVDVKEISEVFATLGDRHRMVDPEKLFSKMDLDMDGHVSMVEFLSTLSATEEDERVLFTPEVLRLREKFDLLDVDGSGQISRHEFRTVMEHFEGHSISQVEMDILMDTIDVDKSGKITFMEILRGLQRIQKAYDISSSQPQLQLQREESQHTIDGVRHVDEKGARLGHAGRHWAYSRVLVQQIVRHSDKSLRHLTQAAASGVAVAMHSATGTKSSLVTIGGPACSCWAKLRYHVKNQHLDNVILFLIIVNVGVVASQNPTEDASTGLLLADAVLSALFVAEVALRLAVYGPRKYFCDMRQTGSGRLEAVAVGDEAGRSGSTWNIADFCLVILSAIGAWSGLISGQDKVLINSSFIVVGRMLRALRPVRLCAAQLSHIRYHVVFSLMAVAGIDCLALADACNHSRSPHAAGHRLAYCSLAGHCEYLLDSFLHDTGLHSSGDAVFRRGFLSL